MPNNPPEQKTTLTDIAILSAIIVTGSILIILGTSKYGVGLTGDSISYIALAKNILKDFSFNDISGEPFVLWPPGYSLSLAFFSFITGADVYDILLPYNLLCYILLVLFLWRLLRSKLESNNLLYGVIGVSVLSPALIRIYVYSFAEVPFLPLLVLFFISVEKFAEKQNVLALLGALTVVMILSLLKYMGIVLLPVMIWAVINHYPSEKKIQGVILSLLLIPLPLLWNLIFNYNRTGMIMGHRGSSIMTFGEVAVDVGVTLIYWVFPLIILVLILLMRTTESLKDFRFGREKYIWGFSLMFLLGTMVMAALQAVDDVNNRLLIPLFIALVAPTAQIIEAALSQNTIKWKRIVVIVLIVLIPLSYLRTNIRGTSARINSGAGGITSDDFYFGFPADILRIKKLVGDKYLFTNNPAVFFYLTGIPSQTIPRKKYYNSGETEIPEHRIADYLNRPQGSQVFIFEKFSDPDHYSIAEIQRKIELQQKTTGDGWRLFSVGEKVEK